LRALLFAIFDIFSHIYAYLYWHHVEVRVLLPVLAVGDA
jgi:hypothetical protein